MTRSSCAPSWCSCAIADGRLADAKDELDRIDRVETRAPRVRRGPRSVRSAGPSWRSPRATPRPGLRIYREAADRIRETHAARAGPERHGAVGAVRRRDGAGAHARYAQGADEAQGQALFRTCRDGTLRVLGAGHGAHWTTRPAGWCCSASVRGACCATAGPAEDALRLLVLADRFAYNRRDAHDALGADRTALAERAAPGLLAGLREQYAGMPARRASWRRSGGRWRGCPADLGCPGLTARARLAARQVAPVAAAPTAARRSRSPPGRPAASSPPRC